MSRARGCGRGAALAALALALAAAGAAAAPAPAQSVLERSPNLQGVWGLAPGSSVFVFAHRFEFLNGGDELFNIPTLTLATGAPLGFTLGLDFSSYSEAVPAKLTGNETQYWLKRGLRLGGATRVAGMVAYNSAAESVDGALSLRQDVVGGRLSLLGELRGFSDRFGSGEGGGAGAVGAVVRLTPYLALTGDWGRVFSPDSVPAIWSGAVAVGIPGTPHTFSLQATNGGALTLQGASREKTLGQKDVRYGFVFTVPLGTASQWGRIFRPAATAPPAAPAAPAGGAAAAASADSVGARVELRMIAFQPAEVRIRAGQSVEWTNRDPVVHTVTGRDGQWGSELMAEGARYLRRFEKPGRYPYFCTPHPQMTGVVVVE